MNVYLDFEATQFGNQPISIGAVADDNDGFYSLISGNRKIVKKVTPFITNLTGITRAMVKDAPSAGQVFEDFYKWCNSKLVEENEPLRFYCYGNDKLYVKNLKNRVQGYANAEVMIDTMLNNWTDCATIVKQHFHAKQNIGLFYVGSYYSQCLLEQSHNALEDARMLKTIYEMPLNEQCILNPKHLLL